MSPAKPKAKTEQAGAPLSSGIPAATGLTARSRALLQFCALHILLLALVMAGLRMQIAASHWLPTLLVLLTAANGLNLFRQMRAARSGPPAALVPRRIRMHLRLLAGVRGLLWIGLGATMFGLCYILLAGPPQRMPAIVSLLACPLLLATKLRWLGTWERRLRRKSDALAD